MSMLRKIIVGVLLVLVTGVAHSQAVISSKTTTPCTGQSFNVLPTTGGGDVVPSGTTYSWSMPATTGNLTGMTAASGASSITGTLTNLSNQQQIATYTITPFTTGQGFGNTFTLTVVVNPYATASDILVTPAAPVICAGLSATLTGALSPTSNIVSPSYQWFSDAGLTSLVYSGDTYQTPILNNNTTYYVRVSGTNACPNQSGDGFPITVTVSGVAPNVILPGSGQVVCAGLTATTAVVFTSSFTGTLYAWTNDNTAIGLAAAGSGTINSFVATNNTNALITANITVLPLTNTNGCQGVSKVYTISVGAVPAASNTTLTICSGSTAGYQAPGVPTGTTYTWFANSVPSQITAGGNTQNTGQPSFNPTFVNSSLVAVDIVFTVTPRSPAPASCPGNSFQLTVTVNPTPVIANQTTTTCSGVAFAISPTGVPAGTLYTWLVPVVQTGHVSNATSQASSQLFVSQTVQNTDPTNSIVRYNITPTSAGCVGSSFSGTVTIYPSPALDNNIPITTTICNNTVFSFTPHSGTSPLTYTWTRATVNGISNALSSGTNGITETLNNNGVTTVAVTYQYVLSANGCNNTQNVTLRVQPSLNLSSLLTKSTCSNAVFAYIGTSATSSTTLSWTRTAVANISNLSATGGTSVNETLINTSSSPVDVIYQYRNTSGSCSDVTNVTVTVNPLPSVNSVPNQVICSGVSTSIALTGSNVSGTVYNWTNSNANVGLTNSGIADIAFLAYDATYAPIAGTVNVTPTANSCNGPVMHFTITVNPSPTLSSTLVIPAVCSGAIVSYSPTGFVANTSFTWSRQSVIGIENAAGASAGGVAERLTNSSNVPLQVPYLYEMTANGCSNTQLVSVTINPVPSMFNPGNQLACNNTTKVVNFSGSIVSGTAYFWTNDNPAIGIPAVGTGDIFFVAVTNTPDSVYANIKVAPQAYGCVGPEVAFKIIVNPPLSLSSSLNPPAVCSNSVFGYTPSSTAANPIYIWNRAAVNGISNSPASGSGSIQEILVNTTSSPINVTYEYTISSNGCVKTESVVVSVSPALVLNNVNVTNEVCSGSAFVFSPQGNITGIPYLWSRPATTGIDNPAANGTGDVNETLLNNTGAPIDAEYHFSLGLGASCAADQVIHVTVKPIPKLTGSKNVDACSNAPVAYTPVSNIPGTNFNWSRAAVAGISNSASVGLVGISESLINTTTATINATYIYSMTNYNGCSNVENVIVALKPAPVVNVVADQSICADDITKAITFTSNLSGTTFNWTNSEPSIGLAASGTGATIPAFKSVNTSSGQLVAIIQVAPVASGCTGNTVAVARITVNRAITTSFIEVQPAVACPGQVVGPFVASIPLGGDGSTYNFQWQVSTDSVNFTNIAGATARQLIAPAITKDSWYRMQTVSLGCSAVTPQIKVAIKPKPVLVLQNRDDSTVSIGNSTQVIVSGANTYLWTPPATVSDFRSASPYLSPLVTTKYVVTGTTLDGCSDSASITVKVVNGYLIYPNNLLTPNGDGFNDKWKIKNIEYYPINKVAVYNVNSIKVWEMENYTGDWTGVGTSGGKLPSGTYYYIITVDPTGTTPVLVKGYLTILN